MSLILGLLGKKVLLLEIASDIGGSLRRFRYDGIPYDVGFHFTGGLHDKGMLYDMLKVLGIWDSLEPIFLDEDHSCKFIIDDKFYNFPIGNEKIKNSLKNYFPQHISAIEKYFQLIDEVCSKTDNMDLRHLNTLRNSQSLDFVSLKQVLDDLTDCTQLKTLLSGYCMCYGTPPSHISFANHARICRDFYQSIGRVKLGGDAFVNAFKDAFSNVQVDVICNTTISECLDIDQARIGRLLLTNGDEVKFQNCIFAIHPKQVLDILPREKLRKALIHRVEDFQSSCGFFSVFGIRGGGNTNGSNNITGMFSSADMDAVLNYDCPDDIAILLLRSEEMVDGKNVQVFTALEPSFAQATEAWADSRTQRRGTDYHNYKQQKVSKIEQYLKNCFGINGETFEVKTSSTMLTYRDYLHSPDGSAYGIKQLIGQFNLFGRLPLRNVYVIGQSALLPGIVGAMMSAFIVARSVEDKEKIDKLIARSLSI
ncbi:MAG: hypothetical protein JXA96_16425 [Sedimentisphaerales bacterium]|nr:hypothetical protein [Sedimentisphaerales bacterium]